MSLFSGLYKKCSCGCDGLVKIREKRNNMFHNYIQYHYNYVRYYNPNPVCYICGLDTTREIKRKNGITSKVWRREAHLYKCDRCFIRDYQRDVYNIVKRTRKQTNKNKS